MKRIFADACYWIALVNRNDQLHGAAKAAQAQLKHSHVVTTDEVLVEFLSLLGSKGNQLRSAAAQIVDALRGDPQVTVVEQSRATFDGGLSCYKRHADKKWSLVDCVSFELMVRDGITDALAYDHHFIQAGFNAILRDHPDQT